MKFTKIIIVFLIAICCYHKIKNKSLKLKFCIHLIILFKLKFLLFDLTCHSKRFQSLFSNIITSKF